MTAPAYASTRRWLHTVVASHSKLLPLTEVGTSTEAGDESKPKGPIGAATSTTVPPPAPTMASVVETTLPWSCELATLPLPQDHKLLELMNIAWQRIGSETGGCLTNETAETGTGATVAYLHGGKETDPAAVVGRLRPPPTSAAVVHTPHITLLRELVASSELVGAFPLLLLGDATLQVFETKADCRASVA